MAWTALGTLRASAASLWARVPFAAVGAVLPRPPFDVIYNQVFRRWTAGAALASYRLPRRFA
jgi:hypothetical protein